VSPEQTGQAFASETTSLYRRLRSAPELSYSARRRDSYPSDAHADVEPPDVPVPDTVTWSPIAVQSLWQRLEGAYPAQTASMTEAAYSRGRLPRHRVYELAGYASERSLRGFTRPIRRVTQQLVDEGLIDADAPWPLQAWYPRPGEATWFLMPPDVAAAIRHLLESK